MMAASPASCISGTQNNTQRLKEIQLLIRRMPVPETVVEAILALVRSARPGQGNAELYAGKGEEVRSVGR